MGRKLYQDTVALMEVSVMRLVAGRYTIGECEKYMNEDIAIATMNIEDINERLEAIRLLKRKAWRMLLDATRTPTIP